MNIPAIKDLIYRLADDELIMGHRNSEWTALGPILEEDIAFSSMAQDEIGHAHAYYNMMHEFMDEKEPDQIAFNRKAGEFRSCQLVEYPIGDFAFSMVRQFLYDLAESIRLEHLTRSSLAPLSDLAKKLFREEKYHLMHAQTWIQQLGNATPEANQKMQAALNATWELSFSIFEPTAFDDEIAKAGIQPHEKVLEAEWEEKATQQLKAAGLIVPTNINKQAHYGGRVGKHTEHLQPLLTEMTEVFAIDTTANW